MSDKKSNKNESKPKETKEESSTNEKKEQETNETITIETDPPRKDNTQNSNNTQQPITQEIIDLSKYLTEELKASNLRIQQTKNTSYAQQYKPYTIHNTKNTNIPNNTTQQNNNTQAMNQQYTYTTPYQQQRQPLYQVYPNTNGQFIIQSTIPNTHSTIQPVNLNTNFNAIPQYTHNYNQQYNHPTNYHSPYSVQIHQPTPNAPILMNTPIPTYQNSIPIQSFTNNTTPIQSQITSTNGTPQQYKKEREEKQSQIITTGKTDQHINDPWIWTNQHTQEQSFIFRDITPPLNCHGWNHKQWQCTECNTQNKGDTVTCTKCKKEFDYTWICNRCKILNKFKGTLTICQKCNKLINIKNNNELDNIIRIPWKTDYNDYTTNQQTVQDILLQTLHSNKKQVKSIQRAIQQQSNNPNINELLKIIQDQRTHQKQMEQIYQQQIQQKQQQMINNHNQQIQQLQLKINQQTQLTQNLQQQNNQAQHTIKNHENTIKQIKQSQANKKIKSNKTQPQQIIAGIEYNNFNTSYSHQNQNNPTQPNQKYQHNKNNNNKKQHKNTGSNPPDKDPGDEGDNKDDNKDDKKEDDDENNNHNNSHKNNYNQRNNNKTEQNSKTYNNNKNNKRIQYEPPPRPEGINAKDWLQIITPNTLPTNPGQKIPLERQQLIQILRARTIPYYPTKYKPSDKQKCLKQIIDEFKKYGTYAAQIQQRITAYRAQEIMMKIFHVWKLSPQEVLETYKQIDVLPYSFRQATQAIQDPHEYIYELIKVTFSHQQQEKTRMNLQTLSFSAKTNNNSPIWQGYKEPTEIINITQTLLFNIRGSVFMQTLIKGTQYRKSFNHIESETQIVEKLFTKIGPPEFQQKLINERALYEEQNEELTTIERFRQFTDAKGSEYTRQRNTLQLNKIVISQRKAYNNKNIYNNQYNKNNNKNYNNNNNRNNQNQQNRNTYNNNNKNRNNYNNKYNKNQYNTNRNRRNNTSNNKNTYIKNNYNKNTRNTPQTYNNRNTNQREDRSGRVPRNPQQNTRTTNNRYNNNRYSNNNRQNTARNNPPSQTKEQLRQQYQQRSQAIRRQFQPNKPTKPTQVNTIQNEETIPQNQEENQNINNDENTNNNTQDKTTEYEPTQSENNQEYTENNNYQQNEINQIEENDEHPYSDHEYQRNEDQDNDPYEQDCNNYNDTQWYEDSEDDIPEDNQGFMNTIVTQYEEKIDPKTEYTTHQRRRNKFNEINKEIEHKREERRQTKTTIIEEEKTALQTEPTKPKEKTKRRIQPNKPITKEQAKIIKDVLNGNSPPPPQTIKPSIKTPPIQTKETKKTIKNKNRKTKLERLNLGPPTPPKELSPDKQCKNCPITGKYHQTEHCFKTTNKSKTNNSKSPQKAVNEATISLINMAQIEEDNNEEKDDIKEDLITQEPPTLPPIIIPDNNSTPSNTPPIKNTIRNKTRTPPLPYTTNQIVTTNTFFNPARIKTIREEPTLYNEILFAIAPQVGIKILNDNIYKVEYNQPWPNSPYDRNIEYTAYTYNKQPISENTLTKIIQFLTAERHQTEHIDILEFPKDINDELTHIKHMERIAKHHEYELAQAMGYTNCNTPKTTPPQTESTTPKSNGKQWIHNQNNTENGLHTYMNNSELGDTIFNPIRTKLYQKYTKQVKCILTKLAPEVAIILKDENTFTIEYQQPQIDDTTKPDDEMVSKYKYDNQHIPRRIINNIKQLLQNENRERGDYSKPTITTDDIQRELTNIKRMQMIALYKHNQRLKHNIKQFEMAIAQSQKDYNIPPSDTPIITSTYKYNTPQIATINKHIKELHETRARTHSQLNTTTHQIYQKAIKATTKIAKEKLKNTTPNTSHKILNNLSNTPKNKDNNAQDNEQTQIVGIKKSPQKEQFQTNNPPHPTIQTTPHDSITIPKNKIEHQINKLQKAITPFKTLLNKKTEPKIIGNENNTNKKQTNTPQIPQQTQQNNQNTIHIIEERNHNENHINNPPIPNTTRLIQPQLDKVNQRSRPPRRIRTIIRPPQYTTSNNTNTDVNARQTIQNQKSQHLPQQTNNQFQREIIDTNIIQGNNTFHINNSTVTIQMHTIPSTNNNDSSTPIINIQENKENDQTIQTNNNSSERQTTPIPPNIQEEEKRESPITTTMTKRPIIIDEEQSDISMNLPTIPPQSSRMNPKKPTPPTNKTKPRNKNNRKQRNRRRNRRRQINHRKKQKQNKPRRIYKEIEGNKQQKPNTQINPLPLQPNHLIPQPYETKPSRARTPPPTNSPSRRRERSRESRRRGKERHRSYSHSISSKSEGPRSHTGKIRTTQKQQFNNINNDNDNTTINTTPTPSPIIERQKQIDGQKQTNNKEGQIRNTDKITKLHILKEEYKTQIQQLQQIQQKINEYKQTNKYTNEIPKNIPQVTTPQQINNIIKIMKNQIIIPEDPTDLNTPVNIINDTANELGQIKYPSIEGPKQPMKVAEKIEKQYGNIQNIPISNDLGLSSLDLDEPPKGINDKRTIWDELQDHFRMTLRNPRKNTIDDSPNRQEILRTLRLKHKPIKRGLCYTIIMLLLTIVTCIYNYTTTSTITPNITDTHTTDITQMINPFPYYNNEPIRHEYCTATQTLESIDIEPVFKDIQVRTAQLGEIPVLADTGASINAINQEIADNYPRHLKTKTRPLKVHGVAGTHATSQYLLLHILQADGTWLPQKFWVIPNLSHRFLAGRPLLNRLGYRLERDFTFVHPADINTEVVDPHSQFYDKIDYFDNDYYQLLAADTKTRVKIEDNIKTVNNPKIQKVINKFWRQCKSSIARDETDIGLIDCDPVEINLKPDAKPIRVNPRRQTKEKQQYLYNLIQKLLHAGIICEARGEWGCAAFLVDKPQRTKKKEFRLVIDYKPLNEQTIEEAHIIPNIQDTIVKLRGKKYISLLDIRSGFYHLPIREEDIHKTTFVTPFGYYAWKRVPMGLKNSPMAFQRCLDTLFKPCQNVMIYIDDVIIASDTPEQHAKDLKQVFDIVHQNNIKLRWDKCEFLIKEAKYLGYIISEDGLKPAPKAVAKVLNFKRPNGKNDRKKLERFLGCIQWLSNFIPHLADMAYPLSELKKQKYEYNWGEYQDKAFDQIKQCVQETPILIYPDLNKPFIIQCDASDKAIGGVLMQKQEDNIARPVEFWSRKLRSNEKNWHIAEKESLAVMACLEKWEKFIIGQHTTVYSDARNLQYLFSGKGYNNRLWRWQVRLAGFNFTVKYLKGSENTMADYLSRNLDTRIEKIKNEKNKYLKYTQKKRIINVIYNISPKYTVIYSPLHKTPIITPTEDIKEYNIPTCDELIEQGCHTIDQILQVTTRSKTNPNRPRPIYKEDSAPAPNLTDKQNWRYKRQCKNKHKLTGKQYMKALGYCNKCIRPLEPGDEIRRCIKNCEWDVCAKCYKDDKRWETTYTVPKRNMVMRTELDQIKKVENELQRIESTTQIKPKYKLKYDRLSHQSLVEATEEDPCLATIVNNLKNDYVISWVDLPNYYKRIWEQGKLHTRDGLLFKETDNSKQWQFIVPRSLRDLVLEYYHDTNTHQGRKRMYDNMYRFVYWPGMMNDVKLWTNRCTTCAMHKTVKHKYQKHLKLFSATRFNQLLNIDLVGPLPATTKDNVYILSMIDKFTRYCRFIPIPNMQVETVTQALINEWFYIFGIPESVLSDNGTQFTSNIMMQLQYIYEFKKIFSCSYSPQTNGQIERIHRYLKERLKMIASQQNIEVDDLQWDDYTPLIAFIYNTTVNRMTNHSPYHLLFGRHPPDLLTIQINANKQHKELYTKYLQRQRLNKKKHIEEHLLKLREYLNEIGEKARNRQQQYDTKRKQQYDKNITEKIFEPGDVIKVKVKNKTRKIQFDWEGPYEIMEFKEGGYYLVRNIRTNELMNVSSNNIAPFKLKEPPDKKGMANMIHHLASTKYHF